LLSLCALGSFACSPAAPRSVILIVIDTLRADHLGLYGYQRATSPELDALASRGAVFDHAFATSPWTLPSFGSLFTGRLPAEHRAGWRTGGPDEGRSFLPLRDGVPTLAETLAARGLDTGAIMNNAFLHPDFGVARGFDTYDHIGGNRRKIRRADEVVDRTLEWLRAEGRGDFFLVVHFFDPHLNYDAPAPFRGRWSIDMPEEERNELMDLRPLRQRIRRGGEVDWDFLIGAYDEEIAFVDEQIARLWRGLDESGALAQSLVVLTADHGEELRDHGGFEHGHTLFNELIRVPLVVWGPGVEPGRYAAPVSLIDVYPTVLEGLGLPAQEGLPGRSLMPLLAGGSPPSPRTLIAERTLYGPPRESALAWPYKLIFEPNRRELSLFDLGTDAAEGQDIARLRGDVADDLLAQLEAYRQHADSAAAQDAVELDEKTLENLRSLGYIQ
jgi:arylsulfatase A-like enzyme